MGNYDTSEFDKRTEALEVTIVEHTRQGILFLRELFEKTNRDIPRFTLSYDGEGGIDIQFRAKGKNLLINLEHSWDYAYISWAGIHMKADDYEVDSISGQTALRGIDDLIDWLNKEGAEDETRQI